jgi:hypothetical protein
MKAGAFNFIAEFFEVDKLHKHSHLYTSNDKVDFPGKMFEVEEVIEFNKKTLKRKLKRQKFNISTRNFPIKPEELQRLFGLKSGGEQHIFFTTYQEEKRVAIICNPKKRATSR